jgi:nucleotide-binding universal stress UspA family protein
MSAQPSVLVVDDGSDSAELVALWAGRLARDRGARLLKAPPSARSATVLDIASKQEVQWLVSGLRFRADHSIPDVDDELATLMRRAPCPLWMVQPRAASADPSFSVGVVGVNSSTEAQAAAHVAAGLLRRSRSLGRLILVHGTDDHPAQMAAGRPWPEIVASMQIERHRWIDDLAHDLADSDLIVEVIVRPIWAPDLIGGMVRCRDADFIALGRGWRSEGSEIRASRLVRCVVRATPCPMLIV